MDEEFELVLWLIIQMEFLRLTIPIHGNKSLRPTTVKYKCAKVLRLVNKRMYDLISRHIRYEYFNYHGQTIRCMPAFPSLNNRHFKDYMEHTRNITHDNLVTYIFTDHLYYKDEVSPRVMLNYKLYEGMVKYIDEYRSWYTKICRNLTFTWYSFLFHLYYRKMVVIGPIISQMLFLYMSQINVMGRFMFYCATFWLLLCLDCHHFYVPSCGHIHRTVQFTGYLHHIRHTCQAN